MTSDNKFRAYTSEDEDSIVLVHPNGWEEHFELYYEGNEVIFESVNYEHSTDEFKVLDSELEALRERLFSGVTTDRAMLLLAIESLVSDKKADRIKLVNKIKKHLHN